VTPLAPLSPLQLTCERNKVIIFKGFKCRTLFQERPSGMHQIPDDLSEKIVTFARRNDKIVAVYIFGSVATAKNRAGSDLDVAIMVQGELKSIERVSLETYLSNLLKMDVHLIVFREASPLLQHQILKYGHLVYENDRQERVRQEMSARREYLDTTALFKVIPG